MFTTTRGHPLPRAALWFVAGLLVISAALFVIGVALERGGENHEVSSVHQDAAPAKAVENDGGQEHTESGEGSVNTPSTAQTPSTLNESIFGIDIENPWLVGVAVLSSLLLVGALVRWGYRVLPVLVLFAIAFALVDVSEVLRQLQQHNTTILLLAAFVLLSHITVGVASLRYLYKYRAESSSADTQVSSITS